MNTYWLTKAHDGEIDTDVYGTEKERNKAVLDELKTNVKNHLNAGNHIDKEELAEFDKACEEYEAETATLGYVEDWYGSLCLSGMVPDIAYGTSHIQAPQTVTQILIVVRKGSVETVFMNGETAVDITTVDMDAKAQGSNFAWGENPATLSREVVEAAYPGLAGELADDVFEYAGPEEALQGEDPRLLLGELIVHLEHDSSVRGSRSPRVGSLNLDGEFFERLTKVATKPTYDDPIVHASLNSPWLHGETKRNKPD